MQRTRRTHDSVLPVEPVKHTQTYFLSDKHWSIYSNGGDEDKFVPWYEWPNVSLPQKPEPEPPAMPIGLVNKLMQQHHTNADILYSLGRDPCKEYKLSEAPAVLARVSAGNKTCSICNRVLASTQSLHNHIRSALIRMRPVTSAKSVARVLGTLTCCRYIRKSISQKGNPTNARSMARVLPL